MSLPNIRRGGNTHVVVVGLAVCAAIVFAGSVAAEIPPQDDPPPSTASVAARVRMKERCVWYVAGVPSNIALQPAGSSVDKVYDGSEYSLAATLAPLIAWNSGNETGGGVEDPDDHAWCTYFGTTGGISVTGQWSAGGFVAAANEGEPDPGVNFDLSVSNPLGVTITEGDCRTPGQAESQWTVGTNVGKTSNTGTVNVPLIAQPRGETTETPANREGSNDRCNINWSVDVKIPPELKPQYAGETYIFTGPTFTTEISLDYLDYAD